MPTPVSALEHRPEDFVREVSPEAIGFYVDELSGIYLPDGFREEHEDRTTVKYWKPEDRLEGKFGRFALRRAEEGDEDDSPLDDILLMGTTIGLSGLDRDGYMHSLRHYSLQDKIREILEGRGLLDQRIAIDDADYGSTGIKIEDGVVEAVAVGGKSYDFGRADSSGRQDTCDRFAELLGGTIAVLNTDPEPREYDRIVGQT